MSWVETASAIAGGLTAVVVAVAGVRAKLTELTGKKGEEGLRDLLMRLEGRLEGRFDSLQDTMQSGFLDLHKRVARVEVRATWGMHADDITPETRTRPGIGPGFHQYRHDQDSDEPPSCHDHEKPVRIRDSVTNETDD
jgi:hypothetical protein